MFVARLALKYTNLLMSKCDTWRSNTQYPSPILLLLLVSNCWENDARCPFGDEMHELVIE